MFYLANRTDKPVTYMYKPPADVLARIGEYIKRTLPIHDARTIIGELSLDKQGFVMARHETAVADFYDDQEVRTVCPAQPRR